MLRPRAQMALENVGSFQYLMYKKILDTQNLGLKKKKKKKTRTKTKNKTKQKKKMRALNFLIPGAEMALGILAYLDRCTGTFNNLPTVKILTNCEFVQL